jgi:hypothetical protein
MRLLALIAEERAPTNDILEMIKRLHIRGYEQARLHFDEAIAEEFSSQIHWRVTIMGPILMR